MTTEITFKSVDQQIHAFKQNSDRINAVKTRPGYATHKEKSISAKSMPPYAYYKL